MRQAVRKLHAAGIIHSRLLKIDDLRKIHVTNHVLVDKQNRVRFCGFREATLGHYVSNIIRVKTDCPSLPKPGEKIKNGNCKEMFRADQYVLLEEKQSGKDKDKNKRRADSTVTQSSDLGRSSDSLSPRGDPPPYTDF